jgi:hypothetical protein
MFERLDMLAVTNRVFVYGCLPLMWFMAGWTSDWEPPVKIMQPAPPWERASAVVAASSPEMKPASTTGGGDVSWDGVGGFGMYEGEDRYVGTGFVLDSFGEPLDYFCSPSIGCEIMAHCGQRIESSCALEIGRRLLDWMASISRGWDGRWRYFVMMRVY